MLLLSTFCITTATCTVPFLLVVRLFATVWGLHWCSFLCMSNSMILWYIIFWVFLIVHIHLHSLAEEVRCDPHCDLQIPIMFSRGNPYALENLRLLLTNHADPNSRATVAGPSYTISCPAHKISWSFDGLVKSCGTGDFFHCITSAKFSLSVFVLLSKNPWGYNNSVKMSIIGWERSSVWTQYQASQPSLKLEDTTIRLSVAPVSCHFRVLANTFDSWNWTLENVSMFQDSARQLWLIALHFMLLHTLEIWRLQNCYGSMERSRRQISWGCTLVLWSWCTEIVRRLILNWRFRKFQELILIFCAMETENGPNAKPRLPEEIASKKGYCHLMPFLSTFHAWAAWTWRYDMVIDVMECHQHILLLFWA